MINASLLKSNIWNSVYISIDIFIFRYTQHNTRTPGSILWIESLQLEGPLRAHFRVRWSRKMALTPLRPGGLLVDPWNGYPTRGSTEIHSTGTLKCSPFEMHKNTHIFVGCFVAILFAFQRPHMRLDSKQPELFQIWGLLEEFIGYCVYQSSIDSCIYIYIRLHYRDN